MTDDELSNLAKEIPYDRPSATRRDALRDAVLAEVAQPVAAISPRWRSIGLFAAGALAAAAVALVIGRGREVGGERGDEPIAAIEPATVTPLAGAQFDHQIVTSEVGHEERIVVHDGELAVTVGEAGARHRVVVRGNNGQLSASTDSSFHVTSRAGSLVAVTVQRGRAELAVVGQRTVVLASGQTWRAEVSVADISPRASAPPADSVAGGSSGQGSPMSGTDSRLSGTDVPPSGTDSRSSGTDIPRSGTDSRSSGTDIPRSAPDNKATTPTVVTRRDPAPQPDKTVSDTGNLKPDVSPAPQPDPKPTKADSLGLPPTAASQRGPVGEHFRAGWALLRAGRGREAALELAAAADADPRDPLAIDARYFQAVALIRAGAGAEAEPVLVRFLDNAPRSLRRGRAAVLLGRLVATRDRASAKAWFESALTDGDADVVSAARAGLESLAQ